MTGYFLRQVVSLQVVVPAHRYNIEIQMFDIVPVHLSVFALQDYNMHTIPAEETEVVAEETEVVAVVVGTEVFVLDLETGSDIVAVVVVVVDTVVVVVDSETEVVAVVDSETEVVAVLDSETEGVVDTVVVVVDSETEVVAVLVVMKNSVVPVVELMEVFVAVVVVDIELVVVDIELVVELELVVEPVKVKSSDMNL